MVEHLAYWIAFALTAAVVLLAGIYSYAARKKLRCPECEMHGMMLGMTFGMMSGFVTATLIVMPTGDFFTGVIVSSIVGGIVGIWTGRVFGGSLGRMEGVMAGPMGGMMGAMLGQMIRPFNLQLFVPFFFALVVFTMFEICYVVYKATRTKPGNLTWVGVFVVLAMVGASAGLKFSLQPGASGGSPMDGSKGSSANSADYKGTAKMMGDVQVIAVKATSLGYEPKIIVADEGIPLRIELTADSDAGCSKEMMFDGFQKKVVIPGEGTQVTINLGSAGAYNFHCSMGMFQGKIIVK